MLENDIRMMLAEGRIADAQAAAGEALAQMAENAELLYLRGQVAMKQSLWGEAISFFLRAEELDPAGPAREAREMLDDIMAFYNKDMYNQ